MPTDRRQSSAGRRTVVKVRDVAGLGMLAVGLGIGAAVAFSPGIASADSSTDLLSSIDSLLSGGALPAPATSALDLDISVDGYTLLDLGSGATATSGAGDIAIAYGNGSFALAEGGFGDDALATNGGFAVAGDTNPGATNNIFDFANANGNGSDAVAGNNSAGYPDTTGSSFDYASANNGNGTGGADATAGFNGSGDSAVAVGQDTEAASGYSGNAADPANFDSASVWGNLTTPGASTEALAGISSGASGSGDTAFVIDPLASAGSFADAGGTSAAPGDFDLAGTFGDALHATATGANYLFDILPSL
jgi:hypothetical protein